MKGSRSSEEQIIGILREAEAGLKAAEVCRRHASPKRHCTSMDSSPMARRIGFSELT
jgi:hypothetical protein